MNTDPRFIRSQEKLYRAIIDLATTMPLEKISVTAIANKADVHRSTVYEHAVSPAQLLRKAVHQELDELHSKYAHDKIGDDSLDVGASQLLRYLEDKEGLFSQINSESGAEVREILRSHFVKSLHGLFDAKNIQVPKTKLTLPTEMIRDFTIAALADMHVSIFAAALQVPKEERSYNVVSEMIKITSPFWVSW